MATALGFNPSRHQLRYLFATVLAIFGITGEAGSDGFVPQGARPSAQPRVIPVYVIPSDLAFDARRLRLHARAVEDVRMWYAAALGGQTFRYDPIVVQRSRHTFAELAADDFQAWWPLLLEEFSEYGLSWNDGSDFKLLFLVQGAGGWAGGDSENGGIESTAEAGTNAKGDLGGAVVIGDSSVSGIMNGVCPTSGIEGGTVWWCNWDTYRGTIAHELGHTWGIPHPDAFLKPGGDGDKPAWDCPIHGNTVMQCHWNFPYDSLLTYEATHFKSLRFFRYGPGTQYTMLADVLPSSASAGVEVMRADVEEGGIAWVDGWGGGTGYPWSVSLGTGSVAWSLDGTCGTMTAVIGRQRGAGGRGEVFVIASGDTLATYSLAGEPPREVSVDVCDVQRLEVAVRGQGRFRAVLGNAHIAERASRGSS